MSIRKIAFMLVLVAIMLAAILQQADNLFYNVAFFGGRIDSENLPFMLHEGKFQVYMDVLELEHDFIRIEGWGALENKQSRRQRIHIFLKNEKDSVMLSSMPVERPDVSAAFKSKKYEFAGYKVFFPTCKIKDGKYRVGFMIEENGLTDAKWFDKEIEIQGTPTTAARCDSLYQLHISDHISLQRYYFRSVGSYWPQATEVGFVGDTLAFPFNEIRAGEAAYCSVPHVLKKGLKQDVIVCSFPKTKTLEHPDNPLYSQRDKYKVLKDFGNGILMISRLR